MTTARKHSLPPQEVLIISAMSENGVIGADDTMPWNVPEEYEHFLKSVQGQAVVMGRKSFEIFGGDFQAATFVVTRKRAVENGVACASFDAALDQAKRSGRNVFIAGGASIYELGIQVADRMLLSTIKGQYDGNVFFPPFDRRDWLLSAQEDRGRYVLNQWVRRSLVV